MLDDVIATLIAQTTPSIGIAPEHMDRFRQDLSEPPERSVQALDKLVANGKRLSAEIAARLLVSDYPDSKAAHACLKRVLAMETTE